MLMNPFLFFWCNSWPVFVRSGFEALCFVLTLFVSNAAVDIGLLFPIVMIPFVSEEQIVLVFLEMIHALILKLGDSKGY